MKDERQVTAVPESNSADISPGTALNIAIRTFEEMCGKSDLKAFRERLRKGLVNGFGKMTDIWSKQA